MKICLYGFHGHRTPLSYSVYKLQAAQYFSYVTDPHKADFLVFSFVKDIKDNLDVVSEIKNHNPKLKLVVLSEEPLWDTVWSERYSCKQGIVRLGSGLCEYYLLNHFTTNIYDFVSYPYFITTSDDYFVRYANLFRRNAALSENAIKDVWKCASIRQAYFAERRTGLEFEICSSSEDVIGLCGFRTGIAELAKEDEALIVGRGWGDMGPRQGLPDWHLDKLSTLDKNAYIVSAVENTHHWNYITEKLFDAFAVLGVPLYAASERHSVNRILPKDSYINLYGLTHVQAYQKVRMFEPTRAFLTAYREAQSKLAQLFSNPNDYCNERKQVVYRIYKEFRAIADLDTRQFEMARRNAT